MSKPVVSLKRFASPLRIRLFVRRLHDELRKDDQCMRYFRIVPLEAVFALHEKISKQVFSEIRIDWSKNVPKPFRGTVPHTDYLAFFAALDRTCEKMGMSDDEHSLIVTRMDGFGDYCLKLDTIPEEYVERRQAIKSRMDTEKAVERGGSSGAKVPFWKKLFS